MLFPGSDDQLLEIRASEHNPAKRQAGSSSLLSLTVLTRGMGCATFSSEDLRMQGAEWKRGSHTGQKREAQSKCRKHWSVSGTAGERHGVQKGDR